MASRNSGNSRPGTKVVRCAIYTRKSTDEGLDQEFNSLDAQRDAAEAFIRSQVGEGWRALPEHFDDGGYTGANMERPALKRLLAAVESSRVDCVLCYKVDRLSRSIRDFGKIMEVLEKNNTTFVSVTQQFNTTSSLGRLTLNILLSFAQFERELISERTKDKQTAARKKGKWTGGHLTLGYDLDPITRKLVVNPTEAERVRKIFDWYLRGESVSELVGKCEEWGWRTKQWTTNDGKIYGGSVIRKAHIYTMLANPLYTGRLRADGELFAGEHQGIIASERFDLAQQMLKQNAVCGGGERRRRMHALLRGLIYCSCCGSPMYPTYSSGHKRRYRYYICVRSSRKADGYCVTHSVSAPALEEAVIQSIGKFVSAPQVLEHAVRAANRQLAERLGNVSGTMEQTNRRLKLGEERVRFDAALVNRHIQQFDSLWAKMTTDEQVALVRQLIDRVGYDGRTGKMKISFHSEGIKQCCEQGAAQ